MKHIHSLAMSLCPTPLIRIETYNYIKLCHFSQIIIGVDVFGIRVCAS
jgi:hypothetical protein